MPTSNRCIKVNLEGDGTFMRGQRPAPIQPMSEACMAEMPEEPVCSQRMSMSCKPGGKPTKPLYPSTIKFPGFSQNSDSPRSTGSFSKCGPWTLGSSTRNRHKEKRQIQARRNIELCKKKKNERVRVKGCVCDVAGSSKVTRRRRQQPQPHCRLAARRVANAGQDIVDAPPGVKG